MWKIIRNKTGEILASNFQSLADADSWHDVWLDQFGEFDDESGEYSVTFRFEEQSFPNYLARPHTGDFMIVSSFVQFNKDFKKVFGVVVTDYGDDWLVNFSNDGVDFRGLWPKNKCKIEG